ncbi:hypothetical protein COCSADRAFT_254555 [Bipolaris sorokiniana ND90Pr]|uniref:Uncharacterized protein n=1 Tax=Cochliobolus sativus (strain ND90Pr / ATCC 201652) TaxID=665912 RepID=M2RXN1_COCSN|nr:uncharacterized protein COCSADRAFT_254555 [Bipolaris sorokiniana ND90Pr]EMD59818.1 hypothetical protein COCSADRAFT_254555 [Bipolaris sorokiniana ND90Pr]
MKKALNGRREKWGGAHTQVNHSLSLSLSLFSLSLLLIRSDHHRSLSSGTHLPPELRKCQVFFFFGQLCNYDQVVICRLTETDDAKRATLGPGPRGNYPISLLPTSGKTNDGPFCKRWNGNWVKSEPNLGKSSM